MTLRQQYDDLKVDIEEIPKPTDEELERMLWEHDMEFLSSAISLNSYQKAAEGFKVFPEKYAIIYPALGLTEEAGEVAGKVKKWLRGDKPELDKEALKKELGDVLWYLASLAGDLGFTLEDVAKTNIEKLTERKKTNTIKGSGDDREKHVKGEQLTQCEGDLLKAILANTKSF